MAVGSLIHPITTHGPLAPAHRKPSNQSPMASINHQPQTINPAAAVPGFKEWSLVCAALGCGAQSIILRKGGIHEGKSGFWWRHDRFFLFPTHFHEQTEQFSWTPPIGPTPVALTESAARTQTIEFLAEVVSKHQITDWETVQRLAPLHFWTGATLRERFDYSEATGISLAFLRVYKLSDPWIFPDEKKFGGCRSWLDLPIPPQSLALNPVLDDPAHTARRNALQEILGAPPQPLVG